MWAIAAALPHELKLLLPRFEIKTQGQWGQARFLEGKLLGQDCVLLQTGVGPLRAEAAGLALAKNFSISHLISTGYAGGLESSIKTGMAFLAELLSEASSGSLDFASNADLLESARQALASLKISHVSGKLLSLVQPALSPSEKIALQNSTKAQAVDMESFYFLKAFREVQKESSVAAIRFIFDEVEDDLSASEKFLDENAQVRPLSLTQEIFKNPKLIFKLPRWQQKAQLARKNMTACLLKIFGNLSIPSRII